MKVRRSQYTADGVWVWTPSIGCGPNARSAFQSRRLYLRTFSRCTSCIELVSVGARVTTLVSLWIELWTCRVQLLLPPQPQTYSGSEVRRRAQLSADRSWVLLITVDHTFQHCTTEYSTYDLLGTRYPTYHTYWINTTHRSCTKIPSRKIDLNRSLAVTQKTSYRNNKNALVILP